MKRKLTIFLSMAILFTVFLSSIPIFAKENNKSKFSESEFGYTEEEYEKIKLEYKLLSFFGKSKSIKKRYTTKDKVPAAVDYEEFIEKTLFSPNGAWYSGILERVGDITVDPITGHYLAVFEGKIF